ncbi:Ribosomal protein S19, superfamily [Pseudocohnilembus persalinus]|uniref:Ribosomal protein S19, superfamily n=1 Tax=Pseudocohnilembus persalinus TaxID=266149 RepID=A0A0V0R741_PSEPJ|nr:Ribosomal protein S19, superfamily [Pseudocohnilembus persalinus]|eukprot:KRX10333.1 Ribosomal protein S19, superfamily [Pseudocohnilembus persalinus]
MSTTGAKEQIAQAKRKFLFRGKNLDELLDISRGKSGDKFITPELVELFRSRIRRRVSRGLGNRYNKFIEKIRKAKANTVPGEKPIAVKTHYRSMIVVPEMVGGVVGIYNGKEFLNVEIKFDMIGKYLAEFAMTSKPTKHGKSGR